MKPWLIIIFSLTSLIIYLLLLTKKKKVRSKIKNLPPPANFCWPTKTKLPKKANQCPNCPQLINDCSCCSLKQEHCPEDSNHSHSVNHAQPNLFIGQFGSTLLTVMIWVMKLAKWIISNLSW